MLVVVGGCLLLLLGQRSLLYPCLFLTPQPSHLPGYAAHLKGLGCFVRVVVVALVGIALPVHIQSYFGGCVHQNVGLPQNSLRLEVLSVVLEAYTLMDTVGLLVWGVLVLALGPSVGVLLPAAAW